MEKPAYFDPDAMTECYVDRHDMVKVVVPSDIQITPDQAEAFGRALVQCASYIRAIKEDKIDTMFDTGKGLRKQDQ